MPKNIKTGAKQKSIENHNNTNNGRKQWDGKKWKRREKKHVQKIRLY